LAEALYTLGRYGEAEQWALRGLELGGRDDLVTQVKGLGVRSRLLARKGQASAALTLAEEAYSLARTSDSPWMQGHAALALADALHLTGDRVRAAGMTQRAIDCYQSNGAVARAARARRLAAKWAGSSSAVSGGALSEPQMATDDPTSLAPAETRILPD